MKHLNPRNVKNIAKILEILALTYPDAKCELNFKNPWELLIATILSAQTTDQKVNKVTAELFSLCPSAEKMLKLKPSELERIIKPLGLFRSKAKYILQTNEILVHEYSGLVPSTMEELIRLPGVGRKTAGVVLANAFGIPAFPVDTHVLRVANRLGLSQTSNPLQVEKDLTALIEEKQWIINHHRFIFHGRRICLAKKPRCLNCPLTPFCPTFNTFNL
ncbi:MAG: endonuclease III [Desulfitobacteriia bacterium]|jgi:endonuclease-3